MPIERSAEEIRERIEMLREKRDKYRDRGEDELADKWDSAILSLKWVLGEEIQLGERDQ